MIVGEEEKEYYYRYTWHHIWSHTRWNTKHQQYSNKEDEGFKEDIVRKE